MKLEAPFICSGDRVPYQMLLVINASDDYATER